MAAKAPKGPMGVAEATSCIATMCEKIQENSKTKAAEIKAKGEEEFQEELHKLIADKKEKVQQDFERMAKKMDTQFAIKKSLAINKQRLDKITERQRVIGMIANDVGAKLADDLKKPEDAKALNTSLIVQGLLMLLEQEVLIRCRQEDAKMVEGVLAAAAAQYADIILKATNLKRSVKLTLDKEKYLAAGPKKGPGEEEGATCLGGVQLFCQDQSISIDNTIDTRMKLVIEQDKPAIRKQLNFDEFFKRLMAKLSPEDTVDDIMSIFELFDCDSTGTISFENLQNIARIIGAKESASQIQDMLSTLDTDQDGQLDPVDFYTCLVSGMRVRIDEENRLKALETAAQQSDLAEAMNATKMSNSRWQN